MVQLISREALGKIEGLLGRAPAVVLTGPRQVGKTTLALEFAENHGSLYLDLELPEDRSRITDVSAYCDRHSDRLIIFDEIQRVPGLLQPIRSVIDRRRRVGLRTGHFLFLGSASLDLLRQSGETLAGRVAYYELHPLNVREVGTERLDDLWHRGGFPESLQGRNDHESFNWRLDFIRTYLERDIPLLGPRIPSETLRRFWTMLAHCQGQNFNAARLAGSLGTSAVTVGRYLDLMVDLLLVRRVTPWRSNLGRRLIKAPKVYIRDSGICHALLGIGTLDDLLGHPVAGMSWEGLVIENLLGKLPARTPAGFYRTARGAEIDLIIEIRPGELWAVEIKRSTAPRLSRGFHSACADIRPARKFVVYPGTEEFPLARDIEALPVRSMLDELDSTA